MRSCKNDRHADVPAWFIKVREYGPACPCGLVTEAEYAEAKAEVRSRLSAQMEKDPKTADRGSSGGRSGIEVTRRPLRAPRKPRPGADNTRWNCMWCGSAGHCDLHESAFELFTDFGIRIKARSKAVQTFVIQLVGQGRLCADGKGSARRTLQRRRSQQPRRTPGRAGAGRARPSS